MDVNPHIFRGYDLRGLVGKDLSPQLAEHLGRAYGTYLKRRRIGEAVVGRDCRQTSPEYSQALCQGLAWAGIDVTDIGMELVGTFYWSQYYLERQAGVYVTASHNPPQFNGFKFASDYSETLVSDGMSELRRLVQEEDYEPGENPGTVTCHSIRNGYFADVLARLPISRRFRVLIDPSCTTAGAVAPDLLRRAGCEVIERNTQVDPTFPLGMADPTEMRVAERLQSEVVAAGADIGFTYDADGDRIGIVDEKGQIIWNDTLLALFAIDVLRDHPGATIMYNTLCSKVVSETIVEYGGSPFMWRTGHSFLKKKNQEVKAAFIGELSGHFFFSADFHNHDDGLYSTLRLLRYLDSTKQTLSQAVASLPRYLSSPEIKIYCADTQKIEIISKIGAILRRDYPGAEIIDDERAGDGIRLDLADAMFVIRYSQNGPYLTIKYEATMQDRYDELRSYISNLLHRFPEIDWASSISVNIEALDN